MGLLKIVLSIVGIVILGALALGAFLWVTDYEVEATITEKEGNVITIRPKIVPRDFQYTLDSNTAQFVCEGYQVKYALRSGAYVVNDRQGRQVYSSTDGLTDAFAPTRCAILGA